MFLSSAAPPLQQRSREAGGLATEKNFRKMMGYRDLWALEAILNGSKSATRQAVA
jgi:hypothetical protein